MKVNRPGATLWALGAAAVTMTGLLAGCSSSSGGSRSAAAAVTTTTSGPTGKVTSAGGIDEAARAMLAKSTIDAGTVDVGLGAEFPPYAYHPNGGAGYAGYEADLMNAIMAKLGLTPHYSDVASVGDAVPMIQSGRVAVAALGITDTAAREQAAIFVDNLIGRDGAIFPAADKGKYATFTDMCGLKVAAVTGSVSVTIVQDENTQCAKDGKSPMTLIQLKDNATTLLAVQSGQADAAMETFPGASYQVAHNPGVFWALPLNEGLNAKFPNGIAVDKNQPQLANAIGAALGDLISDGTYARILRANDVDPSINGVTAVHLDWATNGFS